MIEAQQVVSPLAAMKQALAALEQWNTPLYKRGTAIKSLRQAIAELESQEIMAWEHLNAYGYAPGGYMMICRGCNKQVIDVDKRASRCKTCAETAYARDTHPPQRTEKEPVALTDDEILDAAFSAYCRGENTRELFRIMRNSRLTCSIGWDRDELKAFARNIEALCTHPPPRSESSGKPSAWQGLTDEEENALIPDPDGSSEANVRRVEVLPGAWGKEYEEVDAWSKPLVLQMLRNHEAKLKEKNGL